MPSILNLHLQYRLWIAELNADIDVLRIFDDYLAAIKTGDGNTDALSIVNNYKQKFVDIRKEMDELRHEMHLNKMKLAAVAKTADSSAENIEEDINHEAVKKRYNTFRKMFETFKADFQKIESVV